MEWNAFKKTFITKFTTVQSNKVDARRKLKTTCLQDETEQGILLLLLHVLLQNWNEVDHKELLDYSYKGQPDEIAEILEKRF